jgi:hypothetical protein
MTIGMARRQAEAWQAAAGRAGGSDVDSLHSHGKD